MIVSHSKKFIYIKAKKVAGSSIESMLWESCGPNDVRAHMDLQGFDEKFEGQNLKNNELGPHAEPATIRDEFGRDVWADYHKIVCIRNPWDTLVSLFWMRAGKKDDVKARFESWREAGCQTPFVDFLEWAKTPEGKPSRYTNGRFYFWPDNSLTADTYLRFESLDDDYSKLCSTLDLSPATMRHFKAQFRNDEGTHYSYYFDRECVALMAAQCAFEQKHFNYKFDARPDCAVAFER